MLERRSFLRGLVSLPLIGGSVALIGRPTGAAVAVTDALHTRYLTWLAHEHRAAVREHAFRTALAAWSLGPDSRDASAVAYAMRSASEGPDYMGWFAQAPDIELSVGAVPPSSRAAVVLSAAGVPLGSND